MGFYSLASGAERAEQRLNHWEPTESLPFSDCTDHGGKEVNIPVSTVLRLLSSPLSSASLKVRLKKLKRTEFVTKNEVLDII
jgi:hypothetical protein